ncbi:GGDEF domain-containing protein [Desulfospira joergensenii]|uniref:GGDEF domain-containing protein n=1 Tax=Desulfospira joergensenii TaxID=53329 RepID=UPI0003B3D2C2|nr:GGDEF domain-containing protein [Desulfospira joergensenii]
MVTPLDEKIAILQDQVKKLQSQKDSLIKELDEVEERAEEKDRLYNKYFPVIIDMVAQDEDSSFSRACKEISTGLKKRTSLTKMTYVFEQLKTAMIKEDIGPVSLNKKKSIFSSFKKSPTDRFIEEFKQDYHDLINGLRSCLEDTYTPALDKAAASIINLSDTGDIPGIRDQIFNLLFSYISDTNQDREKVSLFVLEIADKIFQIESKLIISHEQTDSMYKSGQGFESVLQDEMGELKKTSDIATSLEELKSQITARLASIDQALLKKQKTEKVIQMAARKNMDAFKSGFVKLKKELDQATRHSRELEKKVQQDQLTGAFNRRAYDRKILEEMERFKRYGTVYSLLLIDADRFKNINDRYGHAIGDRCLKEIIKRSLPLIRTNDMLARYGGEEFVVIMPETESEGARVAAEKIRKTIEKIEFLYKNEKVSVTVSIGISQANPEDQNHLQVFERADIAVYKAKENGRNQVVVY